MNCSVDPVRLPRPDDRQTNHQSPTGRRRRRQIWHPPITVNYYYYYTNSDLILIQLTVIDFISIIRIGFLLTELDLY